MEIEDITLDFNKICRLCLSEETVMSSLFNEGDSEPDVVPLPLRIMACVSVEISSNDGLPSQICASCLCQVDGWYKFKDLCENADSVLRKCIKNEPVQVETITQVQSMAQEVKKYFSSELKGEMNDLTNENKNMNPKRKMKSAVTRTEEYTLKSPELTGTNFVGTPNCVEMTNSDPNLKVDFYAEAMPSIKLAVPHSRGEIPSNEEANSLRAKKMPCIIEAIPTNALGRMPSDSQIIVNSVINHPIIRPQSGKEQLVANFGQIQLYQINPNQPLFKAPFPLPAREKFGSGSRKSSTLPHSNRGASHKINIKAKLYKWTNVNFDDPYNSLSGNGSDPEMESESDPEPEHDPDPEFENDGLSSSENFDIPQVYNSDPQSLELKNPTLDGKRENIMKSSIKTESPKLPIAHKIFRKEDFGIEEDTQEYRVENSLFTFRLDTDGNIDLVSIIEGDFKDYSVQSNTGHKCFICNCHCVNRVEYNNHLKTEHRDKLKCRVCDKQLLTLRSYLIHMGDHLGLGTFLCPICDKRFARASGLKEHMKRHKGENESECEICGKSFKSSYYLKRHVISHDLESNRHYLCEYCDFKTHSKPNLEYHITSHLNKKEYLCEYCGKRFNNVQTLDYHIRTHKKPKFTCQFCKRNYRWLPKYHKHLKKDHSDKLFSEKVEKEMVQDQFFNNDDLSADEDDQTNVLKKSKLEDVYNSNDFFPEDVEPLKHSMDL